MLIGIDFSHHNDLDYLEMSYDFIFIKATEGRTYIDPKFESAMQRIASIRLDNLPIIGFYHYARPENGNTPEEEADHFLETVKSHVGSCLLALDFEGNALNLPHTKTIPWIDAFLKRVKKRASSTPFLYMSAYVYRTLEPKISSPHRYWIAHHNKAEPEWKPETPYIHQYCGVKIDTNIFNGSKSMLASMAVE